MSWHEKSSTMSWHSTSNNISGEIIVADNGSPDGSQVIAETHGACVINVPTRGYGAALMGGIKATRGRYVIMGDADNSYSFNELSPFVAKLREGYDLVMGNRSDSFSTVQF